VAQTEGRRLEREAAGAAEQLSVRLRVLEEARPALRLRVEARAVGPGSSDVADLSGADVEALAFTVLMEVAKSAQDDLKAILQDVKASTAAKARVRSYQQTIGAEGPTVGGPPAGTRNEDFDSVLAILLTAYGVDLDHEMEALTADLDGIDEHNEEIALRLQAAMDRLSKMISTLSNLLKKLADTSQQLVQNLK
jgi:hypothetical protein